MSGVLMGLGDPFRVDAAVWRSPGVLATLAPSITERRRFQRHSTAKIHKLTETAKHKQIKELFLGVIAQIQRKSCIFAAE